MIRIGFHERNLDVYMTNSLHFHLLLILKVIQRYLDITPKKDDVH